MKVIISGAQCTGKTTLINTIQPPFDKLVIKEQIRSICKANPSVGHDLGANDLSQEMFFMHYYNILYNREHFISDRGLIDVVAYTKYYVLKGLCDIDTYNAMADLYKKINHHLRMTDDLPTYIYLPIEFSAKEDGFRCADEDYRRTVDRCLTEVMSEMHIEPLVLRGSEHTRKRQFEQILNGLAHQDMIKNF